MSTFKTNSLPETRRDKWLKTRDANRKQAKRKKVTKKLSMLVLLISILAGLFEFYLWELQRLTTASVIHIETVHAKEVTVVSEDIREITNYNVGIPAQTDSSPCIGASGDNLCTLIAKGEKVCAANFVALGTTLNIEGYGNCIVLDRMNKRFPERVDIALPADLKNEAIRFGLQERVVKIIK